MSLQNSNLKIVKMQKDHAGFLGVSFLSGPNISLGKKLALSTFTFMDKLQLALAKRRVLELRKAYLV